jgi:nuclear pore complex protein Nup98-Nup96
MQDEDQRAHEKTVCKAFFDRMIENSAIDGSRNGPKAVINDSLGFSFFTLANQTQSERDVVSLAAALWDPIAFDTSGEEIEASKMDAIKGGLKRRALANWFKKVVLPTVEIDLSTAEDGFQKIFYYLSGNYLAKAVLEAIKTRNLRLATILSQVGGPSSQIAVNFAKDSEPLSWGFTSCVPGRGMTDPDTLANIAGQIEIFNGMPIDTYFKYTWSIISGSTGDWEPEMLKLLDWKRVLGLLFWYANGGDLSIERALEKYQPYAEAGYPPLASYDKCHSQDLCFSLLNLSIGKIDVQKVLDPLGHCDKMLNVRLTWFLGKMFQLKGIGENLKADAMDVWTSQAIFQLQDLGLWEYGVYLASFIANEIDRANAIKLIISKQTKIEPEMVDFLVSKLKVPLKWINESQVSKVNIGALFKIQERSRI